MENYDDKTKQTKKLFLLAGATILAIIIIALIANSFKNESTDTNTTDNNTTTSENDLTVSLNEIDRARLNNALDSTVTQALLEDLKTVMLADGVSSQNNISISIGLFMTNLSWKVYPPYTTYTLSLITSNNLQYDVDIANKGTTCYGILIRQFKPTKGQPYLFIVDNTNELDKYNSTISDLVNWGKKLYPDGIIVNTHY